MAVKKTELYSLLWEACNKLRGGVEPARYKDYVLVLLFFKYVSDRYKGQPFAEFTISKGASFDDLILAKGKPDVGERVDKIIQKFLEDNRLQGSLPDVRATPYNGVQIKRNILESERSQGCPSKSLPGQTTIRLPDKVCQPGSGLPEQTSCSVLQSVFAALGSGSYKTGAAVLPQQKHVPPWHVRRISRVLCA